MRRSTWRCWLLAFGTLTLTSLGVGCRSAGWNMPGSSWLSWNKKKPPVSSIAGTHDPIRPPSVSVPPYPASESSHGSPATTALASAATGSSAAADVGYGQGVGPGNAGTQPAAGTADIAVGPYRTGSASAAPSAPNVNQGFYAQGLSPSDPASSINGAGGAFATTTGSMFGAAPPSPTLPQTGGMDFAPVTTPERGAEAAGPYPSTDYPAFAGASPYPQSSLPSGPPTYPAPNPDPAGAYGSYPPPTAPVPNPYAAPPLPAPSSFGGAAAYTASSPYGGYAGSAPPPPVGGATSPSLAPSAAAGEYRPGSTSRNSNLLGPVPSMPGQTPGGSGTYYNR